MERDPNAAPKTEDDVDDAFNALWDRVVEAWDDDKPHQAILGHSIDKQLLPVLAGRYRKLQDDPEKGVRAKKKIDGIVVAATQMMLATKTPPRTKMPTSWVVYFGIFCALVIAFVYWKAIGAHR